MTVLIIATAILIANLVFEYYRHQRNVNRIPIRVHVNGTRGKSSVTRLIAAGLRAGGIRTLAKTTGTIPRVVLPDGRESSIVRLFAANIIEQKYVFRYAASVKPQAIVVECMAVNPDYQWVTERKFVRSTVGVMTNVRPDHEDLMGSTVESVAMSLSNTIPRDAVCFTSEEKMYPILKHVGEHRGTETVRVSNDDVTNEELEPFHYIEHSDNLALALAVCKHLGVDRETALKGMQESQPDPGALTKFVVNEKGKRICFYNVFAANDPQSSLFIWKKINMPLEDQERMIVLNTRGDRLFRSHQLINLFCDQHYDYFILTGERTEHLENYALDDRIHKDKLVVLGEVEPQLVYDKISELTKKESHVVGIGNMAGTRNYGAHIVHYFRNKSKGGF